MIEISIDEGGDEGVSMKFCGKCGHFVYGQGCVINGVYMRRTHPLTRCDRDENYIPEQKSTCMEPFDPADILYERHKDLNIERENENE